MKDKFEESDRQTLQTAVDDENSWLNSNPNATVEEYEERKKTLEGLVMPIMSKLGGSGGNTGEGGSVPAPGGGMPTGGMPTSTATEEPEGPDIEEID